MTFSSSSSSSSSSCPRMIFPNSVCRPPQASKASLLIPSSVASLSLSTRSSRVNLNNNNHYFRKYRNNHHLLLLVRAAASSSTQVAPSSGGLAPAIDLTDNALKHLNQMRSGKSEDLCLRIGVKQGGCSGMSYTMEFESKENTRPDDTVMEYNGFVIVCDPKSLLFIFGMQLDFSDALIGGGFSFKNPNATQTCGCGKSFNA